MEKNNSVKYSDELANQKVTNDINKECPKDWKTNVVILRILLLYKTKTFKSHSTTLLMDSCKFKKAKHHLYITILFENPLE